MTGAMATALIIDDDPTYAEMLRQQLEAHGHQVLWCPALHEARACLSTFPAEVVLLDVGLPDGNGLRDICAIKAGPSQPEVIIITGLGDQDGAEFAVRAGAWDYWQKTRPMAELRGMVERALAYRADRLARRAHRMLDRAGFVGRSPAITDVVELVATASASDTPVLLRGETGTGKEVAARLIHRNGPRAHKPFVVVDCGALTENLVESVLFGHDRGAFTGASADRLGLVRQAHGGTLFLDELGELPIGIQRSFLRVLQEKRFRPVGADHEVMSDFRIIAATNRDLGEMVQQGTFREDLYYRLRGMEIVLPPLRMRSQDARELAVEVIREACERLRIARKILSPGLADALERYPWPGNVRELRQTIECAIMSAGESPTLDTIHLPTQVRVALARAAIRPEFAQNGTDCFRPVGRTLSSARDAAVSAYLRQLVLDTKGDVESAHAIAGVSRSRFYELLKLHGLTKPTLRGDRATNHAAPAVSSADGVLCGAHESAQWPAPEPRGEEASRGTPRNHSRKPAQA